MTISTNSKIYRDGYGDTEISDVREEFRNAGQHLVVIIDLVDGRHVELNFRSAWDQGCKMIDLIKDGRPGVFGQWGRIE
jgi:hypothetical protein